MFGCEGLKRRDVRGESPKFLGLERESVVIMDLKYTVIRWLSDLTRDTYRSCVNEERYERDEKKE